MDKIIKKTIQEQMSIIWDNCDDPEEYDGYYDSNPYGVEDVLIGSSGGWQYPDDDSILREEVIESLIIDMTPILENMDEEVDENTKEIILSILKTDDCKRKILFP